MDQHGSTKSPYIMKCIKLCDQKGMDCKLIRAESVFLFCVYTVPSTIGSWIYDWGAQVYYSIN